MITARPRTQVFSTPHTVPGLIPHLLRTLADTDLVAGCSTITKEPYVSIPVTDWAKLDSRVMTPKRMKQQPQRMKDSPMSWFMVCPVQFLTPGPYVSCSLMTAQRATRSVAGMVRLYNPWRELTSRGLIPRGPYKKYL